MKIFRFVKETGENGGIGYHQAVVPQLLLLMFGEGLVRGGDTNFIKVQAGDAVYWEEGEWHETRSETGMTAIVIESGELNPAAYMGSI